MCLINVRSSYLEDVINELPDRPIDESLDAPPSDDEILKALGKMKSGKAGGKNGILPEMLKCCGEKCVGRDETLLRWQEHFCNVLNIRSSYLEDVINEVPDRPIDESLDALPSDDEIFKALGKMKSGKAGGKNGILPEMLKCCGANLLE